MFRRNTTHSTQRKARLGVQTLEAREVPASPLPPLTVPDYAGSTPATARVMTLPAMQQQTANDYLPSATDVDMYRVQLKKGDYLIADVDPTGTAALASTLQLFDAAGSQLAISRNGPEPETGVFNPNPSIGYFAHADGTYFLRLSTTAAAFSPQRSYALNLERIALDDSNMSPARLNSTGAFHAWLNQTGDTLNITGPTGYGFSLRGTWTKTVSGPTVTYAAQGTIYLRTPFLTQSVGEIALQPAARERFTVTTKAPGWDELGELTSIGGHLGLSLAPIADQVRQVFGIDVSDVALAAGWTIKTGAQIKQDYQSYIQRDIAQLLDGVPYLVYGAPGHMKLQFGGVTVTSTDQSKLVLIADPADPFLYVGYKNYAAAGSLNGHIPFHTDVAPPADGATRAAETYGHVYAAGTYPIAGLPANINGDVTVDLDANRDGQFLGGAGNASQLLHGDLGAIDSVLRDMNVGVNGGVNLGYTVAGRAITVPLGQASVFYSGPKQGIWFKGVQGTAMNPWAGTVLENFQSGPGAAFEGYVYRDGHFSVAATSNFRMFAANAALTLTVTDHDISAKGTITTPIGHADVVGTIGFNGNFHWEALAQIDIGGGGNYLRGTGLMTFDKIGSQLMVTTVVDATARMSIPGFKAEGHVSGLLRMTMYPNGSVSYSADLHFDGGIYVWNALTQKWNKLASVDVSLDISGNKLILRASGHTFSMTLPG